MKKCALYQAVTKRGFLGCIQNGVPDSERRFLRVGRVF